MQHPDSELIDLLGGTGVVAELCEVAAPSVSEWRKSGIPKARLMFLRVVRPKLDWGARDRAAASVAPQESPQA